MILLDAVTLSSPQNPVTDDFLLQFQEALSFDQSGLSKFLPRVLSWLHHMTSLPRLQAAAFACGLNIQGLKSGLEAQTSLVEGQPMVEFFRSNVEQVMENDMELRYCPFTKKRW